MCFIARAELKASGGVGASAVVVVDVCSSVVWVLLGAGAVVEAAKSVDEVVEVDEAVEVEAEAVDAVEVRLELPVGVTPEHATPEMAARARTTTRARESRLAMPEV
jgi:hypothetical protein